MLLVVWCLDAQNSSEGSKSEGKKTWKKLEILRQFMVAFPKHQFDFSECNSKRDDRNTDLSAICDSGFGEHCCSKHKMHYRQIKWCKSYKNLVESVHPHRNQWLDEVSTSQKPHRVFLTSLLLRICSHRKWGSSTPTALGWTVIYGFTRKNICFVY